MSRWLEHHWKVESDVDEAFLWYEEQKVGLRTEFLDSVEQALGEIADLPTRYGFAERDVREYVHGRFPHAIYYRVLRDRIRILAVYHSARDPDGWRWRN